MSEKQKREVAEKVILKLYEKYAKKETTQKAVSFLFNTRHYMKKILSQSL